MPMNHKYFKRPAIKSTKEKTYQRAVRFEYLGTPGQVDKNNRITYGTAKFHLDDLAIESGIRHAIHVKRNT